MNTSNELGTGHIGVLLWRLSLPAIFAQVVNALYNIVDRIYIGHIKDVGAMALTGLGVTFPILIIIGAFGALIGAGGAPLAAISMGAGHPERGEHILGNCVTCLIFFSFLLTVLALWSSKSLLLWFGASAETLPYAMEYLDIYLYGTVFALLSWGLNSFIATQGFAAMAMLTSIVGAVINIILDPLFIFGMDMGVRGAAVATVIAQAASAAWVIWFLCGKKTILRIRKKYLRIRWHVLRPVLALGLSPFVMVSTDCLVIACLNSSMLKYGGDLAVGAMTISGAIVQIAFMPLFGVTQGSQPIISYNYGAKHTSRVRRTFRLLLSISLIYAALLWLAVELAPFLFVGIFTTDPKLTALTVWAMRISMAMVLLMGIQFPCQQTFVALNQPKKSLFLALLRKIILLIPLVLLLPHFFEDKLFAVFLAMPVSDFLAVCTTSLVFALSFKRILASRLHSPQET